MKYITSLALALAFLLTATPAFARDNSERERPLKDGAVNATVIACVKTAVATRESALLTGFDAFADAIHDARVARASTLADAYSKTTRSEVRAGVKSAWTAFKTASKTAKGDARKARGDAWKSFKDAAKACKGGDIIDTEGAKAEEGV